MWFVYCRFKLKRWGKYSSQKRLRVLQAVENKMAKKNHRDPIDVVVHERSDWHCLGSFSFSGDGEDKKIYIHEKLVMNPACRFDALETIIHEGRHASQHVMVNRENIPWWNFKARRMKKNFAGYISSSEDRILYNNQDVERDAQKYTIKQLMKHRFRYRKEADFQKTLDRNIYRYDKADDEARKKYGIFYKFKMRRKIDRNSRN